MSSNETLEQAVLLSKEAPSEAQKTRFLEFLRKKYGRDFDLVWKRSDDVKAGFILEAGDQVYDWSAKARFEQLKRDIKQKVASRDQLMPLMRQVLTDWNEEIAPVEMGKVLSVGDGIATLDGLEGAAYGEILVFDSGVRGMIQDFKEDSVGCILFGDDEEIEAGSMARRTGRTAGIPVGEEFLGRVIDALGNPVDGLGEINSTEYRPMETPAPGILDRQPVNVPMETGILSIDSMFPIGRGQRELIIGDRQTGKTAIATDTIINQKGKDVVCIYVAIGQKASSVSRIVGTLKQHGAMDYTIVINATASDPVPLQYIAPYTGCSMAEYFMYKGKDVLIVYDDLSKHAIAYRALSLLLERSPGREAYPGDVFYLHSRLLERSAHLSDGLGGGSITALPIVETQAGDVSAYIPTNIISITDGQIFLESDLFFAVMRPAVNVGLSVSRVGGDAQTKAMKKAAGALRLDLAQYREMQVFTQFSSDLDDMTKRQLVYGEGLMMLLRQPQYSPYSQHQQVILLVTALAHLFEVVPTEQINTFSRELLEHFEISESALCRSIDETGTLPENIRERIIEVSREYIKESFLR